MLAALLFLGFGSALTTAHLPVLVPLRISSRPRYPKATSQRTRSPSRPRTARPRPRLWSGGDQAAHHRLERRSVIVPQLASARVGAVAASDPQRKARRPVSCRNQRSGSSGSGRARPADPQQIEVAMMGSQEDIAVAQDAPAQTSADSKPLLGMPRRARPDAGIRQEAAPVTVASRSCRRRRPRPRSPSRTLSRALASMHSKRLRRGTRSIPSTVAKALQSGDRPMRVRAVAVDGDRTACSPCRFRFTAERSGRARIALNDVGAYAKSKTPGTSRAEGDLPLRDAAGADAKPIRTISRAPARCDLYHGALRNRLPCRRWSAKTIMLLSRAQDLEQEGATGRHHHDHLLPGGREDLRAPGARPHRLREHRPYDGQSRLLRDAITAGCTI